MCMCGGSGGWNGGLGKRGSQKSNSLVTAEDYEGGEMLRERERARRHHLCVLLSCDPLDQ